MMSKKNRRKAYLEQFRKNADGSYTYEGKQYRLKEQAKSLLQIKLRLWAFCAGALVSLFVPGCLMVPGLSRCAYILIPYAVGLAAGVAAGWSLFRFCTEGYPLREYVYLETISKTPGRALLCALGSLLATVGEAVFLIRSGPAGHAAEAAAFLALGTAAALLALALRRYAKAVAAQFQPEPQTQSD